MSIGYTDCPCRDCFEISMDHEMCSDCEEAGCTSDEECQAPGAYGEEPHDQKS